MISHLTARSAVVSLLIAALLLAACQPVQPVEPSSAPEAAPPEAAAPETDADVAPLLGNLGDHHHPITTDSELAQQYFNEGMVLTYGFNHAEAIRSFEDALKLDPECAMCYWGIAYALGPNINAPMDPAAVQPAWEALQKAIALAPGASEAEQAYIEALAARYSEDPAADRAALDQAYAAAMRELAARYPDDLDAATLFAEALMDLTPWNFWTKDGQPTEYTNEIIATLESVLAREPNHIGANHFYIHAVEASPDNERAIPSAERLATLAPGAGHLVHMPAHTYWRVGRYHDAAQANHHAIHSDESYFPDRGIQSTDTFYGLGYYNHNIHFLFAAAQMEGDSATAIEAARKLVAGVPVEVYMAIPALEDFAPMTLFALLRFGKWNEILAEAAPDPALRYTTGVWHYARGIALTRLGRFDEAAEELAQVQALAQAEGMDGVLFSFSTPATNLTMAGHILAGELAAAQGDFETAVSELEAAVAIQDSLPYIEPPSWYYPVRQSLGAVLLEAGHAEEAEAVYREDLRQYPKNGWSLYGLAQALAAQGKSAEAAEVEAQFAEAWAYADVELTASRF